jgi:hypothetical protein
MVDYHYRMILILEMQYVYMQQSKISMLKLICLVELVLKSGLPGEGGYSKIRFTMKKDEEYILTGLFDAVNAPFLYRKATLIAVVGGGGGWSYGRWWRWWWYKCLGEDGEGRGGGSGGPLLRPGTLPSNGIFVIEIL